MTAAVLSFIAFALWELSLFVGGHWVQIAAGVFIGATFGHCAVKAWFLSRRAIR